MNEMIQNIGNRRVTASQTLKPKIRFKLSAIIEQFMKAALKGEILTRSGDKFAPQGVRVYKGTLNWLKRYSEKFGIVYLDMVTPQWGEYFQVFLMEHDMAKSSIASNLSRIKNIMTRAYKAGISPLSGFGIRCSSESTTQVYNTFQELKVLFSTNFNTKGKNRVRDMYVMNCFLGMRIGDYRRFLENPRKHIQYHEGKYYIEYISEKTNTISVLPLGYIVRKTLMRNNFDFGKIFSYQHFNKYIKLIAKEAGINESVVFNITKGGEKRQIIKQKHEMMSNHTARRTFASLLELMDMPRPSIMKMTGHSTEQSFKTYVRVSTLQNAIKVKDHEFFNTRL